MKPTTAGRGKRYGGSLQSFGNVTNVFPIHRPKIKCLGFSRTFTVSQSSITRTEWYRGVLCATYLRTTNLANRERISGYTSAPFYQCGCLSRVAAYSPCSLLTTPLGACCASCYKSYLYPCNISHLSLTTVWQIMWHESAFNSPLMSSIGNKNPLSCRVFPGLRLTSDQLPNQSELTASGT